MEIDLIDMRTYKPRCYASNTIYAHIFIDFRSTQGVFGSTLVSVCR
jgi:hypothetical protein